MVKKGEIAGAAYVVARGGRYVHHGEVGYMDLETSTPFRLDTICRLLSMTKVSPHHHPPCPSLFSASSWPVLSCRLLPPSTHRPLPLSYAPLW